MSNRITRRSDLYDCSVQVAVGFRALDWEGGKLEATRLANRSNNEHPEDGKLRMLIQDPSSVVYVATRRPTMVFCMTMYESHQGDSHGTPLLGDYAVESGPVHGIAVRTAFRSRVKVKAFDECRSRTGTQNATSFTLVLTDGRIDLGDDVGGHGKGEGCVAFGSLTA